MRMISVSMTTGPGTAGLRKCVVDVMGSGRSTALTRAVAITELTKPPFGTPMKSQPSGMFADHQPSPTKASSISSTKSDGTGAFCHQEKHRPNRGRAPDVGSGVRIGIIATVPRHVQELPHTSSLDDVEEVDPVTRIDADGCNVL